MSLTENLTAVEAAERASVVSKVTYDVSLDITSGTDFGSDTTITFAATPGTSTFVDITALTITTAVLNGVDVDLSDYLGTRLAISDLAARNELRISARHAYSHEGTGLHRFVDPVDDQPYLHSQFEPFDAHRVYPCFDQPDLKATFDFTVTAPSEWLVVSNMAVRDTAAHDQHKTWHFETTPLVSSYITAVVAGPFATFTDRHGDIDLGIYCRRSLAEYLDVDEIVTVTKQGLDFFADAFGMTYPFGKYDQLFVPEFFAGAMENPGCITFSESYIFRGKVTDAARERRAETILHEMAHMWFGDLVTMRWWDDLWLNESFATYMSVHAQAAATRFTNAWVTFSDQEKAWAKMVDQLPTTHPIVADAPDVEAVHQNFDGITYAKGASVLRQLVAWVGVEAFLKGCRDYFAAFAYANASLSDFLGALERASGRDLDAWSTEWLQTTGVNTLTGDLAVGPDGRIEGLAVVQSAAVDHPTLRSHRIGVGLYNRVDGSIVRTGGAEVDIDGERTEVPALLGRPAPDLLVLNDGDLTYAKLHLDERSLATIIADLSDVADDLTRALLWGAAWDMVRDGQMRARDFVTLIIENAKDEPAIGVLQTLQRRAMSAITLYGDPANMADDAKRFGAHAHDQMRAAGGGSDEQFAWARAWAHAQSVSGDVDQVRAVLHGEATPTGLALDTDLRWFLLGQLAAADAVNDEEIAALLADDPTDIGERGAATARASRPTQAAKDEAWERLLHEDGLSHTVARALLSGYNRPEQRDVLERNVDRYFEAIDEIWAARGMDVALEIVEGTFPLSLASKSVLDRVDEVLAGADLPGPLRRSLLEQRDSARRVMTARANDIG